MTDLTDKTGKISIDTDTEEVAEGEYCIKYDDYYSTGDTASVWYGTYKFLGWFMSASDNASGFDATSSPDSDLKLYGHWELVSENETITALRKSETKAQLYYTYTANENDSGAKNYNISNIGLRIGGFAGESYMGGLFYGLGVALKSYISAYGIVYSTVTPKDKGYDSFTDALKAGKYSSNEKKDVKKSKGNSDMFAESDLPASYNNGTEEKPDYHSTWNVFFKVNDESLDKIIYAAAYLKLTNGDMFYFSEKSCSVKSLAAEYLEKKDELKITDSDQLATLALLKEGKTSSTDTNASEN